MARFEEKRSKGISESWHKAPLGHRTSKKELRKSRILSEEAQKKIEQEKKKEIEEAQSLIHKILGDQNYDAAVMFKDVKELGGIDLKSDHQAKKLIFMQWFLADPKTRKPETLYELCKILEVPMTTGRGWMESDWFVSDMHGAMQKNMKLAMPYLARMVLGKAIGGDFNAIKEFLKVFGKHEKKEGESDWNDLFDETILSEVDVIEGAKN